MMRKTISRLAKCAYAAGMLFFMACAGTPISSSYNEAVKPADGTAEKESSKPLFTGAGGKGITIAVPSPALSGGRTTDGWMPQLFQDLITADLARYSAMTVLDRHNESLAIAEQQRSASGNYSDDDYIAMGRLTNAQYIAAGTILGVSGRYSVSFRINNTETNGIQASFNKQYGIEDIESGLAAKEAVRELLAGMGVELSSEGERRLLAVQEKPVRASLYLAQGMASEKNGNLVESLVFFHQAVEADQGMREASQHIQNFGNVLVGASIREKAQYAQRQTEQWNKIFSDLQEYVVNNLPVIIYDFSGIDSTITEGGKRVNLAVSPGIKLVPNRTVLEVWKRVAEEWYRFKKQEENKSWTESVRTTLVALHESSNYDNVISYSVTTDLFDGNGDPIKFSNPASTHDHQLYFTIRFPRDQVLSQSKYYTDTSFSSIRFRSILTNDITTDTLTPKIDTVDAGPKYGKDYYYPGAGHVALKQAPLVLSVSEWEQWLANGDKL